MTQSSNKSKQTTNKVKKTAGDGVTAPKQAKNLSEVYAEYGFNLEPPQKPTGKSLLDIDDELAAELKELDFVGRWINFKKFKEMGFHKRDWQPYKRRSKPKGLANFTTTSEGFMLRQDLIFAVKPRSYNELHKKELEEKVKRQSNTQAIKKAEFEQHLRASGSDSQVVEDYD